MADYGQENVGLAGQNIVFQATFPGLIHYHARHEFSKCALCFTLKLNDVNNTV